MLETICNKAKVLTFEIFTSHSVLALLNSASCEADVKLHALFCACNYRFRAGVWPRASQAPAIYFVQLGFIKCSVGRTGRISAQRVPRCDALIAFVGRLGGGGKSAGRLEGQELP